MDITVRPDASEDTPVLPDMLPVAPIGIEGSLSDNAMPDVQQTSLNPDLAPSEILATRQLSQMQLILVRFQHHRLAMIGLVIFIMIILSAIFAPLLTPENPYDPLTFDPANATIAPTLHHWDFILGTDVNGHAILSQILWGGRVSLTVGIVSAAATALIGFAAGATAGYFGGSIDTIVMRITDIFLTLPSLPVLLIVSAFVRQNSVLLVIMIFTFFGWSEVARLVRSSYLSLRHQEFVEAARAVGVPTRRIIFRHIAPNALRPVIVSTTLAVARFILLEAAIDYLQVGISPPTPTWGNILSGAQDSFGDGNWWWTVFPGIMVILTVLSVNFIGDGLGDALDVKSRL